MPLGPRLQRLLELCPDRVLEDVVKRGLPALDAYFQEVLAGAPGQLAASDTLDHEAVALAQERGAA